MLYIVRHLVRHRCSGRPRALRVEEGICRVIAHLAQEREHLSKILLRLARKSHNEIGRQARLRQRLAHTQRTLAIFFHRIAAVHCLQESAAAVLHGEMDVLADMRAALDRIDQLVADVLRVRGHEAHAANALHLIHHAKKIGKIRFLMIFAVGVHILSKERHLAIAFRYRAAHLCNDLLRRAAALASAHIGHDAVRTVVVAAVHDRHPCRELSAARNGQILRDLTV